LEHGRGTWDWINNIIDSSADRHHKQYGCWYNKNILSIVQEAGLQVDSCWRWHFGTTYFIVASPASRVEAVQQQQGPGAEAAQAA
jgi:methyltransferase OMS1